MLKIKQWLGAAGLAVAAASVALPAQADELGDIIKRGELRVAVQTSGPLTVSYTHLTLPTNREV